MNWISINDQIPTPNQLVLMTDIDAKAPFYEAGYYSISGITFYNPLPMIDTVTHWCVIPDIKEK
ncbi:hypothetical protein FKG96_10025 [Olivibacter sp. LS-1]|uniref:hypothetical protein n=1 Tax=Olivibacter sp. LS-1 TaxID=2592345 RepID=UPI0011EAA06F|nr:hypothetical protein [Olivibacter sp. LS-1]QEL01131.1 hypothetical protein FKG96_10025 [Olivibacter sp. LS-1]